MPPAAEPEAQRGSQLPTESSPESSAKTSNESSKNLEPDYIASIDFLRRFHPNRNWVLTAISLDKKSLPTATFTTAQSAECIAWLERHGSGHNLYYSVGEVPRAVAKKAERTDISKVWWLHVDVDPRANEELAAEQARILKLLAEPPHLPPPTVIVGSGSGYQAFWQLREPLVTDCKLEAAEDAALYNQKIEWVLEADNCHDVSRIMRLPGTLNHPDAKKLAKGRKLARAEVVEWHAERIYDIGQFEKAAKQQSAAASLRPKAQVSGGLKRIASLDELPAGVSAKAKVVICQGFDPDEPNRFQGRSEWLFFACCEMVRGGCSDEQIYSVVTDPEFRISDSVLDKGLMVHRYALRQVERAREEAIHPALRELNDKFFVISNLGGKCRVCQEYYDPALERYRLVKQTFEDFRNRFMHRQIVFNVNNKQVMRPLGQWWLSQEHRKQYECLSFSPLKETPGDYNLWQGYGVVPSAQGSCELYLRHMLDNICSGNEEHYKYLLGWMANAVQKPAQPGQIAVVLRGKQGCGKSIFVKMFGKLFGRHYMRISDIKHLTGNFNAHLRDVVVLFSDEAYWAGDKKSKGMLKSLITDNTLTIEAKGVDSEQGPNYIHLLMASNEDWVVPAEVDDRRFFVLDAGKAQLNNVAYFEAIREQMEAGGYEKLLHYLQNYDLKANGFVVQKRPITDALNQQKEESADAIQQWLLTLLMDGALPGAKFGKPNAAYSSDPVSGNGMTLYVHARQTVPGLRAVSDRKLSKGLQSGLGAKPWKDGCCGWQFPSLKSLRAEWELKYGKQDWPGGSDLEWGDDWQEEPKAPVYLPGLDKASNPF